MKQEITVNDIKTLLNENKNTIIIDVRSKQEYSEGHLSKSISIPYYDLLSTAPYVIKNMDTPIIVYCQHGTRGRKAANILRKLGYAKVFNLEKGIEGLVNYL